MGLAQASLEDPQCRGCMVVNAVAELAAVDPEVAAFGAANRQGYEDLLYGLLQRAQQAGEIGGHHDLQKLARYLVNAIYGLRVTAKTTRDRAILRDIVATTLSILD